MRGFDDDEIPCHMAAERAGAVKHNGPAQFRELDLQNCALGRAQHQPVLKIGFAVKGGKGEELSFAPYCLLIEKIDHF